MKAQGEIIKADPAWVMAGSAFPSAGTPPELDVQMSSLSYKSRSTRGYKPVGLGMKGVVDGTDKLLSIVGAKYAIVKPEEILLHASLLNLSRMTVTMSESQETDQPLRYDPRANTHNGQKLVRGELLRDAEGQVYILDRERGFFLNVDVAVQNPDGFWRPTAQGHTFSVDPSNKDEYRDLFLMGKNVFESKMSESQSIRTTSRESWPSERDT